MLNEFDIKKSIFIGMTDDYEHLLRIMKNVSHIPDFKFILTHEDFANSMLLMSLCKHHIGSASTFSFWGSYLDKNQPNGGKTIFPTEFHKHHPKELWPFEEWHMISEYRYMADRTRKRK